MKYIEREVLLSGKYFKVAFCMIIYEWAY